MLRNDRAFVYTLMQKNYDFPAVPDGRRAGSRTAPKACAAASASGADRRRLLSQALPLWDHESRRVTVRLNTGLPGWLAAASRQK
jgi:hypothetical protein